MDRIEFLQKIEMGQYNYWDIINNYFDQLMNTYNLFEPHVRTVSVVNTTPTSIVLDLYFPKHDMELVKTLSNTQPQNINLYNREFEVKAIGVKSDTNLVDGSLLTEYILTICILGG